MPENGTSGSMSEDGKRSVGHRPQATAPILDSTETEVTRRPRFDRDRMKSEHNSDIAEGKGNRGALPRRFTPPAKNRRAGRHKP